MIWRRHQLPAGVCLLAPPSNPQNRANPLESADPKKGGEGEKLLVSSEEAPTL
jgi:hypothetical protein